MQQRLRIAFTEHELEEGVWRLSSDLLPFQLVFYRIMPFRERVKPDDGLRPIHIDEDRWLRHPSLLLNRIAAVAGQAHRIYARDTVASRIDKHVALSFQEEHHLQVALPGKYRFGLFHRGDLVAVAVFSGGRAMRDRDSGYRSFELLRFCHKQGRHVVGGFTKLLEAFRTVFLPADIMTYADKDWSDGHSYEATGFRRAGETDPQLFWVDRQTMRRYHDRALPADLAEKTLEERKQLGYVPVYNGGSIKFVKLFD